ncbi:hypothetical protein EMCRGX_G008912 [Ephydatia muelleri]
MAKEVADAEKCISEPNPHPRRQRELERAVESLRAFDQLPPQLPGTENDQLHWGLCQIAGAAEPVELKHRLFNDPNLQMVSLALRSFVHNAAISPNALAAPSRNLIYRSLENLLVDTDEFDKYELDELDEQLAFAVVYGDVSANRPGIKQGLVLEENRTAKRQRYQEDVEENRAAKRQKYEDNSAAIKASERNRYWNDPAVRLAKRAAERKRYRRGHRTTTTTQSYSLYEFKSHALKEYNGGLEKAILRDSELLSEVNDAFCKSPHPLLAQKVVTRSARAAVTTAQATAARSSAPSAASSSSSTVPTTSSSRAAVTSSSSRAAPAATSSSSRAAPAATTSSSSRAAPAATSTSPTTGTNTSAPTTTSPAAPLAAATTTHMAPMATTRPPREWKRVETRRSRTRPNN